MENLTFSLHQIKFPKQQLLVTKNNQIKQQFSPSSIETTVRNLQAASKGGKKSTSLTAEHSFFCFYQCFLGRVQALSFCSLGNKVSAGHRVRAKVFIVRIQKISFCTRTGDGNFITDCTSKKNTKEAGLLLMLQGWAKLSFSSLVVPNLRPLVFYPSAHRVQNLLADRAGRGVSKRELRKGRVTGVPLHSSSHAGVRTACPGV